MRADEEHAAPSVAEARVGVEQVGRPVEGDNRLARARATVDDVRAPGACSDDGVLVGLDGAQDVPHAR